MTDIILNINGKQDDASLFFFLFLTSLPPQTELSLRHARLCIVDKLL